jgi:hypothetical protein
MSWIDQILRRKKEDARIVNEKWETIGYVKESLLKSKIHYIPKKEYNLRG